ncbi:hypothetical protein ONZ51_g1395 [Trametes cubensis]|uniref:Uncharacterized protein n=1 Tax=Trametes cubensis TaxID=1111947 RepID=A0AAD7U1K3_9APHY|nr:hypothetical protein ONZ51_g1395 [Trametes cubensis]
MPTTLHPAVTDVGRTTLNTKHGGYDSAAGAYGLPGNINGCSLAVGVPEQCQPHTAAEHPALIPPGRTILQRTHGQLYCRSYAVPQPQRTYGLGTVSRTAVAVQRQARVLARLAELAEVPEGTVDVSSRRARDTSTSIGSGTLSGSMDVADVDALCCSPDCDRTCCLPPPCLVYSPASSSSLALSDTPPPVTPLGLGLSPHVGFPLLTPDGTFHLNTNVSPDIKKPGGTLAERRGAKALALQRAPTLSDLPQPTSLLTPRTPDSASSFAQRLVGFIRSPTPESTLATPPTPEYAGDPFGGRSSSFYNDPYFFATVPVCPHPDLYDFDVYGELPARPQNPIAKTCGKRSRVRLFVAASDLQLDDSDMAVSPPSSQTHSVPCARSPSLDRPDTASSSPPSTPISAPALTLDLPRSTPAAG